MYTCYVRFYASRVLSIIFFINAQFLETVLLICEFEAKELTFNRTLLFLLKTVKVYIFNCNAKIQKPQNA